ncbi:MAG: hypothetical protein AB1659_11515, partial [Thermodesulfobacteriota bacterium]
MPDSPEFQFFLYGKEHPVIPGSSLWYSPLPVKRTQIITGNSNSGLSEIHLGGYFTAARSFLEQDHFKLLTNAASRLAKRLISSAQIRTIGICIKKHGGFYHPARVEILGDDVSVSCVLNVALSEDGAAWIQKEYHRLKRLTEKYPYSYLPEVFGIGAYESSHKPVRMFLGEWLEG